MLKRIVYIGLSYPSLYDYEHQATKANNDLCDSPNPLIDSPLGLMILYDELWFLCESLCPNNIRTLPYVKFVDIMFPDLWFEGAEKMCNNIKYKDLCVSQFPYFDALKRMNINYTGCDTHTHTLKIGNVETSSNGGIENYSFDLYVLSALQNRIDERIEMISNPKYCIREKNDLSAVSELTEKLIISDIPNYLSVEGPYHECIEELRENAYLKDFRKWIISKHGNIQRNEISDVCVEVTANIKEAQKSIFKKHLEQNNKYSMFKSTGKTIISTVGGFLHPAVSVLNATVDITANGKQALEVKSDWWQGFIVDAQDISSKLNY